MVDEEFANLGRFEGDRVADARDIFEEVTLTPAFPAYARFLREALAGGEGSIEGADLAAV